MKIFIDLESRILWILIYTLFLITINQSTVSAQTEDCGVLQDSVQSSPASVPCFNIDSIFANCIPVYIRVNFHFFVNNDYSGNVSLPLDGAIVTQEGATGWANYIIFLANEQLANNQPQLNAGGYNTQSSPAHCNPIRYILKGVYFHNSENDKFNGYNLTYLKNTYAINPNSEINIFMSSFNHTMGSGAAFGGGSINSINRFDHGLLNHELAHNLDLIHTFENDLCDDTPNLTFDWDKDCDGQIENCQGCGEYQQRCWSLLPQSNSFCNRSTPCINSPCCDPGWISNSIMSYNNPNDAWTNCQIIRALDHISLWKCDFIEQIGGNCPPVSAFITRLPKEIHKPKHCGFCFDLNASTGYSGNNGYKVEIYDNVDPANPVLMRTTNWLSGFAIKYCIGGPINGGWQDGMQANHPYLIKLIVKNDCSESSKIFPFILPVRDCTITGENPKEDRKLMISPNPATDNISIHYELDTIYEVRILITHQIYSNFNYLVSPLTFQNQGTYDVNVPIQSFYSGLNVVILQVDGLIYTESFIKQ